jgi:hypothetical protein
MATFEQLLRIKIQNQISEIVNDNIKVIVTNDLSNYASGLIELTGDELFMIIASGTGKRQIDDTMKTVTQTTISQIWVNQTYYQQFLPILNDWVKDQSAKGNIQYVPEGNEANAEYYYFVDYTIPFTDGVPVKIGGEQYIGITLSGDFIYSERSFVIGGDIDLYILEGGAYKLIRNLTNWNHSTQIVGENGRVGNNIIQRVNLSAKTIVLSFNVIFDKEQEVHRHFKNLAYLPTYTNAKHNFMLVDHTLTHTPQGNHIHFDAYPLISLVGSVNAMTVIQVQLTLDNDPTYHVNHGHGSGSGGDTGGGGGGSGGGGGGGGGGLVIVEG